MSHLATLLGVGALWQNQTVLKGFRVSGCYHTALLVKGQIAEESASMGHIKESSDVVLVGIRVAFAGDVEPLRSLDIGRMAQNQMPVR